MAQARRKVLALLAALFALCMSAFVAAMLTGGARGEAKAAGDAPYVEYGADGWKYRAGYFADYPRLDVAGTGVDSSEGFADGKAPFGFGAYGQYDLSGGTEFAEGEARRHRHYIFTKKFTVSAEEMRPVLRFGLKFDDGLALVLNGKEIFRENVEGYDFSAVGETDSAETVGRAEERVFCLSTDLLAEGENVLTAILVEDYKLGHDAYFDLSLTGADTFTPEESDMPDTVSLTFYDDPFTTRGVTFWTSQSFEKADVRYRKKGAADWQTIPAASSRWYGRVGHKAVLSDLEEGTEYEYAAGSAALDVWGDTYSFETASRAEADESFDFYFFTDTQASEAWQFEVWKRLEAAVATDGIDYDFSMHGGDLVEGSTAPATLVPEQWQWGLNAVSDTLTSRVMMPVVGNHEYAAYAYSEHFNIKYKAFKDTGAYYSFDYGSAHITVLNANDFYYEAFTAGVSAEQKAWLEEDLAETDKPWKIVAMHFSPVSNGTSGYNAVIRSELMPLFAKYEVDLVLAGHTHQYFRSKLYAHGDGLAGADREATVQNLHDSVIEEDETVTYTDLADGTIWTVSPGGVEYLTAKSSNYNVYYSQQSAPSDPSDTSSPYVSDPMCEYATNPFTGKPMNGGYLNDDTGLLIDWLQYVSIKVTPTELRCNVMNVSVTTGERVVYDTYNVRRMTAEEAAELIAGLPDAGDATHADAARWLDAYGLADAFGDSLSAEAKAKIAALRAAVSADALKAIYDLNAAIAALDANDTAGYEAANAKYLAVPETCRNLVNSARLDEIRNVAAVARMEYLLSDADKISVEDVTEEEIERLESEMNELTAEQRERVPNASVLGDLRAKLNAREVWLKIKALKTAPTAEDVAAASAAYERLSAKEKSYVENYDVLRMIAEESASTAAEAPKKGCKKSARGAAGAAGALVLAAVILKKRG